MIVERKITVQKPISGVWQVLGNGFADAYKCATVVSHSQVHGNGKNGASCDYRVCQVKGLGETKENVLKYSDKDYLLSYQIEAAGFPKMVKFSSNTWRLKPISNNETEVTMQIEMQTSGIMGTIMKPLMKMQMGGMASLTISDFKHFVETGRPSIKKTKALRK